MLSRLSPGVTHGRRSATKLGSFFFEPVQLYVQLADLPVQFLDYRLMVVLRLVLRLLKHPRNVREQPAPSPAEPISQPPQPPPPPAQPPGLLPRGQSQSRL